MTRPPVTTDSARAPAMVMLHGLAVSSVALEALPAAATAAEIIAHRGTTAVGRDRAAGQAQRWLVATVGEHGRNSDEWWLRWGMVTAMARDAR